MDVAFCPPPDVIALESRTHFAACTSVADEGKALAAELGPCFRTDDTEFGRAIDGSHVRRRR